MKFDMKKPCTACPFLKGSCTNETLTKGRLKGIVRDIRNDMSFTCHKTLDQPKLDQQHCGGAMIFLEREERPNQAMRFAERIRLYNHKELDMSVTHQIVTDDDL